MTSVACSFEGCNKPQLSRGYCVACYARLRRTGKLPRLTPDERLFSKIEKSPDPEGCWLWTGSIAPTGYGLLRRDKRTQYAHRFMYERLVGEIPDGLVIDHLCRVRNCVNPKHLEPVTQYVNVIRGDGPKVHGSKTHCLRGHPFTEENTYVFRNGRHCRLCKRERQEKYNARKRGMLNALPLDPR